MNCNFTPAKVEARKKQIEESIQRYLDVLEKADRTQPGEFVAKTDRLKDKIETQREQMRRMKSIEMQLAKQAEPQISLTDPDARSMVSLAKGTGVVGYNVQVAVDTKHHLIVAHEVTNVGNDRAQLSKMAIAAREAMDKPRLRAYADRGYFNGPQIKECDDAGITAFVPKPLTSNAKFEGRFDKRDFIYIAKDDEYRCPAGEHAIHRFTREERELQIRRYWSSACPAMSDEVAVHAERLSTDLTMGTRGRARCHAASTRSTARGHDAAKAHRRTRLWNAEVLDGLDALPDASIAQCGHRDELAGARL